jgi:hypothetical protein
MSIFLITNVVNTGDIPWTYAQRSVYSSQERFEHALNTIQSIRNLKDDSKILFIESSQLSPSMEEHITNQVDFYYNISQFEEVKESCIRTNKKGYGEVVQIKFALEYMRNNNIDFKRIIKISGRYWLNTKFDISKFSFDEYTFNKGGTNHSTILYSVPKHAIDHYYQNILKCIDVYKCGPISLEDVLPPMCNPKHVIETLGVSGMIAVNRGEYIEV